ncbi:MAG: PilW family protein, partial [Nevskiales bacterium]
MNRSLGVKFPQAGYSLTELMVAITIGLIILGGTLQVFTASKESFRLQEGVSRAQETGRMGIFILNRSLRHTGFYRNPSLVPSGFRIAFPAVAANGTTPAFLVGSAVSGTDGGGANPDLVAIRHQQHEDGTLLD